MLPFIEEHGLYQSKADLPVRNYILRYDPRNPGTDSTISYCTNGTLLSQSQPRLPGSFGGRTSNIVVVMERSGMDGAHKWTNSNNVLGTPGNPPPFPQFGVSPAEYLESSPQGFTWDRCVIGLGDGSARTITTSQKNGWPWACDPADKSQPPSDW